MPPASGSELRHGGLRARSEAVRPPGCGRFGHREWNADSTFALCAPDGFVRIDENTWARLRPGSPGPEVLTVHLIRWPEDSAQLRSWPLRLTPTIACRADCVTVDSVTVHTDTIAGVPAHTETGLLSGGLTGLRREPHLVTTWQISSTRRGVAQGQAAAAATLDTLREAVSSLQPAR